MKLDAHNVLLEGLMSIDGTIAAAHGDEVVGEGLWSCGAGVVEMSKVITGSVNIVRIKASSEETATNGHLEDVLITLGVSTTSTVTISCPRVIAHVGPLTGNRW